MYPEPQAPHFSFRGFAFLVVFCVLCLSTLMPGDKTPAEAWHIFTALMVFATFLEVWHIRNPRLVEKTEE